MICPAAMMGISPYVAGRAPVVWERSLPAVDECPYTAAWMKKEVVDSASRWLKSSHDAMRVRGRKKSIPRGRLVMVRE